MPSCVPVMVWGALEEEGQVGDIPAASFWLSGPPVTFNGTSVFYGVGRYFWHEIYLCPQRVYY